LLCRNGEKPKFSHGAPRPDAIVTGLSELVKTLTAMAAKRV
jgi:hypothetical protein